MDIRFRSISCDEDLELVVSNFSTYIPNVNGTHGSYSGIISYSDNITTDTVYLETEVSLGGSYYQMWFVKTINLCDTDDNDGCLNGDSIEVESEFDEFGDQDWLFNSAMPHQVHMYFYDYNNQTSLIGDCTAYLPKKAYQSISISSFMIPIIFFSLSVTFLVVIPMARSCYNDWTGKNETNEYDLKFRRRRSGRSKGKRRRKRQIEDDEDDHYVTMT